MKYFPEDRSVAASVAAQFEKKAVWWRRQRWFAIILFIAAVGLITMIERQEFYFFPDLEPEGIDDALAPTPELNASSIRLLHSMIETQYVVVRTERALLFKGMIPFMISILLLVHVMSDWNRHKEYEILAKLVRNMADDSPKDPPANQSGEGTAGSRAE